MLPAIQPHADMLGENAVFEQVPVPVFLIHGPRIAPFGGTVFFTSCLLYTSRIGCLTATPACGWLPSLLSRLFLRLFFRLFGCGFPLLDFLLDLGDVLLSRLNPLAALFIKANAPSPSAVLPGG